MATETQRVDLGEQLDITVVGSLKPTLTEALGGGQPIELDGGRLQRADTAGIQLLLAFSRAAAEGPGWRWAQGTLPPAVAEAAGRLGLVEALSAGTTPDTP